MFVCYCETTNVKTFDLALYFAKSINAPKHESCIAQV